MKKITEIREKIAEIGKEITEIREKIAKIIFITTKGSL